MSELSTDIPKVKLPRIEGTPPTGAHVPLIERYLDRLPFARRRPARQPAGGLDAAAARAGDLARWSARPCA